MNARQLAALQAVKAAIRQPYAWPGGYPLYVCMADGESLSVEAARANWREIVWDMLNAPYGIWNVAGVEINWEDPDLFCCHSGDRIESAYAEPEMVCRPALPRPTDHHA